MSLRPGVGATRTASAPLRTAIPAPRAAPALHRTGTIAATFASLLALALPAADAAPPRIDPVTVHVFHDDAIHFLPDDPARFAAPPVEHADNGRAIERTVTLTPPPGPHRIFARVTTKPVPQDVQSVHDKWDRAGNVQIVPPDGPPIELVKFITAYGGRTEHRVDVTRLAPVLRGERTFRGFIDTWVSPAWRMDLEITFEPVPDEPAPEWTEGWTDPDDDIAPAWVRSVLYEQEMSAELLAAGPREADVQIPAGARRVMLRYVTSGHCTDGRGADEFETRDNVILVDGVEVHRFRPWRADCRAFRDVNPYCRRWFDGSWSADFDRSGWCPGDAVEPVEIDLTGALAPGPHRIGFLVEDVRPKDESGHGYWRVSAALVGWE